MTGAIEISNRLGGAQKMAKLPNEAK